MSVAAVTRNGGYLPGQVLRDRVLIPGWEERSVWGWDPVTGSLYAQLWQNIDRTEAPRYWLDGHTQRFCHPGHLALVLLETTSLPPMALIEGLGLGGDRVLTSKSCTHRALEQSDSSSPHGQGMARGAQWVLGQSTQCPGTHLPWLRGVSPTAQVVHAEHVYALGHLARTATFPGRERPTDTGDVQRFEGVIAALDAALHDPHD